MSVLVLALILETADYKKLSYTASVANSQPALPKRALVRDLHALNNCSWGFSVDYRKSFSTLNTHISNYFRGYNPC